MNITQIAQTRYTTKAFDPARKVPAEQIDALLKVLHHAPSSVNSQPWHFVLAESADSLARIADTLQGGFAYNAVKVRNASQVIVFCARNDLGEDHLAALLAKEEADGRFPTPEAKVNQNNSRNFYVKLHREERGDLAAWIDRQVYIALGTAMLAAGALGIDACPMEGIDTDKLDAALGLTERGLRSVVLLTLGYRSSEDFNAKLPKSRLPADVVISRI